MKRGLLVVLSVAMVLALSAVPSTANNQVPPHEAAGAFVGEAALGAGLYSPVSTSLLPPPLPSTTACGVPAGVCPGAATANWALTITLGAGGHYSPPGGGNTNPDVAGIDINGSPNGASVQAGTLSTPVGSPIAGVVRYGTEGFGAWCGYSSGDSGAGILRLTEGAHVSITGTPPTPYDLSLADVGWQQSAGTVIVFHGRVTDTNDSAILAAHGTIDGVVSALPPNPVTNPGQSCLNGTAQTFTVVGGASASWHDG